MALVDCLECRGSVSDQADACPHCGAPTAKGQKEEDYKGEMLQAKAQMGIGCAMILAAPVIILVGLALFALFGWVFG